MKQVIYTQPGEPNTVLNLVESPVPTPQSNEILIRTISSAVTPADMATIRGVYRTPQKTPAVPGYDGVGEIAELGTNVRGFKVGQKVLVSPIRKSGWQVGFWQEYFCLPENYVIPLGEGIPPENATLCFNLLVTSWVMLVEKLNLGKGQTLLLTAAGSSIGQTVLKLAKLRGFKVIAVVRRPDAVDELLQLGATHVICTAQDDITKKALALTQLQGVDAVIDSIGGEAASASFRALAENGKMISYGLLDLQRNSDIDIRKLLFYNLSLSGFWLPGWWMHSDVKHRNAVLDRVFSLLREDPSFAPYVEQTYSFDQIKEAVIHSEKPGKKGAIYIKPNVK